MTTLHRCFALAAAIAIGCAAPPPRSETTVAPRRTIPFRAVDEPGEVRPSADYVAGVIELGDRTARVLITERVIRGDVSARPETIEAGLAYGDQSSNNWHSRGVGRAVSVRRLSRTSADTLRDTLVLELPIPSDVRLEDHWLHFRLWGTLRPPGATREVRGFRSMQTRPDLFR